MTKNDINQIIVDFARQRLSPTKKERDYISAKYEELQTFLDGRTFQNGSYARFTSTTPVHDLDVFYILPEDVSRKFFRILLESTELDIANILESLAEKLGKLYAGKAKVKPQPHSVGIYFGNEDEFSIDVVPAIPAEKEMYWVPESSRLSIAARRKLYESHPTTMKWIKSHPRGYISDASRVDKFSNGNFRKTAKFVKKWKLGCKETNPDFALKSFHLEQIVTQKFSDNPGCTCIDGIEHFFSTLSGAIQKPQIPDKADSNRYIDQYVKDLSENERPLILQSRDEAISVINHIKVAETEAEALNLIEKLLKIERINPPTVIISGPPRVSTPYSKPYCNDAPSYDSD